MNDKRVKTTREKRGPQKCAVVSFFVFAHGFLSTCVWRLGQEIVDSGFFGQPTSAEFAWCPEIGISWD